MKICMDKTIRKNFDQSISRDIIKRYGISGSSIQMIRFNNNFIFNVVNENDEYILRITHESQKIQGAVNSRKSLD